VNDTLHAPFLSSFVALVFQGASWTSEYSLPLMLMQTLLGFWNRGSAAGRNITSKLGTDVADHASAYSY
jgi:DNA-binding ferritin-like protein (Dps family)